MMPYKTLFMGLAVLGLLTAPAAYGEQHGSGGGQADKPAVHDHHGDHGHQHGKAKTDAAAAKGEKAPSFTLKNTDGEKVSLSDYAGKVVVLEWINPECPYVQRHYESKTMQQLADKYDDKDVVWLAINSTSHASVDDNKAWIEKYDLDYPILVDKDGKVGKAYDAKTTPHMFVIDQKGRIAYEGAIDNDPSGKKDKQTQVNYVDGVLARLTENKKPEYEETKPYGCSVKYPK